MSLIFLADLNFRLDRQEIVAVIARVTIGYQIVTCKTTPYFEEILFFVASVRIEQPVFFSVFHGKNSWSE
jgi:hypothetical protein